MNKSLRKVEAVRENNNLKENTEEEYPKNVEEILISRATEELLKKILRRTDKNEKLLQNAGITLIVLIITIIILLILAGIALHFTLGENGIIKKAMLAKTKYEEQQQEEKNNLDSLYSSMLIATNENSNITISMEDLNKIIDDRIKKASVTTVPAGTVITYMGNNAPIGYLPCDGNVYNISDYLVLAEQIKNEFGSFNYYGGDGETTFALPDLRGEFLRGTGTNIHSNSGNGLEVGKHQDATNHLEIFNVIDSSTDTRMFFPASMRPSNYDTRTEIFRRWNSINGATVTSEGGAGIYTSRPTNTSVLYCIKY